MDFETLNSYINNSQFLDFINSNINADTNNLRLKKFKDLTFDPKFAILQIDCKKRIQKKLPEIYTNKSFLFPSILASEQCTAQEIAKFHSTLFESDEIVLDMTAGLCIDVYYISKKVKHITALELNPNTALLSKFNMSNLTKNVTVLNQDCIEYINNCETKFDTIFIDPARRGDNNKRLFGLTDCQPNIIDLIPNLKNKANTLIIKASPMLDISQSISDLNNCVTDIWVIGINNECKELLFKVDLHCNRVLYPILHTINYERDKVQELSSSITNSNSINTLPESGMYLYEPNKCIMKAKIFDTLEAVYNVSPIQKNSHLFLNSNLIENFPGRCFVIEEIIPFKSSEIKHFKNKHPQINVSVRNFKFSADELKNKLKIKDGGEKYLFGTTDCNNNAILIICSKI
ncbi:MAG: hypothetical protein E7080_00510 [Bacteroidales bacterium]|nr:hypothetical protein [Bacteroidales bacterium]